MMTTMTDEQRLQRNEYMRGYNAKHREAILAKKRDTRIEHLPERREHERQYEQAHSAGRAERQRRYRAAHPDVIAEAKARDYQRHREKRIATVRAYAQANPEKIAEQKREYERTHRAEIAERKRAYYLAHRDAILAEQRESGDRRAYQAAYRGDPAHRATAYCWWANRRAERYGLPDRLTPEQVLAIEGPCAYCGGEPTGWDHVVPMAAGGPNTPANLVPACFPCNRHKGRGVLA